MVDEQPAQTAIALPLGITSGIGPSGTIFARLAIA